MSDLKFHPHFCRKHQIGEIKVFGWHLCALSYVWTPFQHMDQMKKIFFLGTLCSKSLSTSLYQILKLLFHWDEETYKNPIPQKTKGKRKQKAQINKKR